MNKICTSIEQSKKLIELGIDKKTSDMYYWCGEDLRMGGYKAQNEEYDISAWSLSALLNLLPIANESTYEMHGTLDGGAIITHEELTCVAGQADNPLDAVYELVCWLKESGKL